MEYFTHAYIEGVDREHDLQHLLGLPSDQNIINALSNNLIIDCLVLLYDARHVHAIYVPVTAILKVKVVIKKPKHI